MFKSVAFMSILFLIAYILPLGHRPLFEPDEARYAEVPREMLESGNWLSPQLNGVRYFEKPAPGYWPVAAAMRLFGENAFAARLPSALAAGISALLVFLLVRRFRGEKEGAPLATLMFLSSGIVFGVGTFSVLDTQFSMLVTASVFFFYHATCAGTPGKKLLFAALAGVFCGFGFMTKGFLAFALPAVVFTPFLAWERRWRDMLLLPWASVAACALVCLPWILATHVKEPDFWNYFFWQEHIERFTKARGNHHPKPFWFFIPVILGGALPWALFFPAGFRGYSKADLKESQFLRFLLCWLVFPFLLFSVSTGKLATYILPCLPPLCILLATGLLRFAEKNPDSKLFKIPFVAMAAMMVSALAGLLIVRMAGIGRAMEFLGTEHHKWVFATTAFLAAAILCVAAVRSRAASRKLLFFALGPAALMAMSPFAIPCGIEKAEAPEEFILANAKDIRPETVVFAYPSLVRSVCWYLKRNDVRLLHKPGELEYGIGKISEKRLYSFDEFRNLVETKSAGQDVVIFMQHADKREAFLPKGKSESSQKQGELFFIRY